MAAVSTSLVILGCSQRKRQSSGLLPAIDRYDGPSFRVLRKRMREAPDNPPEACVLSGLFGLIQSDLLIPRYDQHLAYADQNFRKRVDKQLKRVLDDVQPDRLFVSVGSRYWPALAEPLDRELGTAKLSIANGAIGGRASQLSHWLRANDVPEIEARKYSRPGRATLLGTTVEISAAEIIRKARKAMVCDQFAAHRFETWHVVLGHDWVAPKWLVSILFNKPVSRFRTADARRVLSILGVECLYASQR